jgi:hypothetical protein
MCKRRVVIIVDRKRQTITIFSNGHDVSLRFLQHERRKNQKRPRAITVSLQLPPVCHHAIY